MKIYMLPVQDSEENYELFSVEQSTVKFREEKNFIDKTVNFVKRILRAKEKHYEKLLNDVSKAEILEIFYDESKDENDIRKKIERMIRPKMGYHRNRVASNLTIGLVLVPPAIIPGFPDVLPVYFFYRSYLHHNARKGAKKILNGNMIYTKEKAITEIDKAMSLQKTDVENYFELSLKAKSLGLQDVSLFYQKKAEKIVQKQLAEGTKVGFPTNLMNKFKEELYA